MQVGAMLGVTRARSSEIERDPTNVGFAQLQRIVHLLDARLVVEVRERAPQPPPGTPAATPRGEWKYGAEKPNFTAPATTLSRRQHPVGVNPITQVYKSCGM